MESRSFEDEGSMEKITQLDTVLSDIQDVFFDLDGTLYISGEEIPGASALVQDLRAMGKNVYFLSNNTSKNKQEYVDRLAKINIVASVEDFISPIDGLIDYLEQQKVKKLYVLGTQTLQDTFETAGFDPVSTDPEFVIIGYDTELTYQKLTQACAFINKGVKFIATHPDNFCPSKLGPLPDVGSFLKMIEVATGKCVYKIFGKPHRVMLESFLEHHDINPTRGLIVGDRLYTDIHMAAELKMKSLLVLSGDTQLKDVEGSKVKPDFILDSVADLNVRGGRS
ncbi:MAG: HAD-IIA family hydrolase [Micrococcaceae bacterium]